MRYNDFSGKKEFKKQELDHELRNEKPYTLDDLARDQAAFKKKQAQSNEIKMVALHYLNVNDEQASELVNKGLKIKKDRKGVWYLPEYNTSGQTFQNQREQLKSHIYKVARLS